MSERNEQDRLIEEAARWIVLLHSGQAGPAERQAYFDWRAADPRHDDLCAGLEKTLGVFQVPVAQGVRSDLVRQALDAPSSRRQFLQHTLVGAGLMFGGGLLANRSVPLAELSADLQTPTGQRQTFQLQDGSQLTLNARSAVDLDFSNQQRHVRLRSGEMLLKVAAGAGQPFIIDTRLGQARLAGDQLLVRQGDDSCRVVSFATGVGLLCPNGAQLHLPPASQVSFDGKGFGPVLASRGAEAAWVNGLLEVHDRPLGEVIDALRPYRRGVLRLDPAAAGLRVSGLYHLDDSDLVLEALSRTLPIRVARRTDLWVTISAV